MSTARILQETLRQADGGRVEFTVATAEGPVHGIIEQNFFEDFMGTPSPQLSHQRRMRIITENVGFLESEAARQLRLGNREVVIR